MKITAKLTEVLPLQTGISKNGQWRKQDIIVETEGQYPKKICFSIWGDNIKESQLIIGTILDISFELESREFNGKWYTDVKAWKINFSGVETIQKEPDALNQYVEIDENDNEEDLPF